MRRMKLFTLENLTREKDRQALRASKMGEYLTIELESTRQETVIYQEQLSNFKSVEHKIQKQVRDWKERFCINTGSHWFLVFGMNENIPEEIRVRYNLGVKS